MYILCATVRASIDAMKLIATINATYMTDQSILYYASNWYCTYGLIAKISLQMNR